MGDLKGMYVKSAQLIAAKGDILPWEWAEALHPYFESVPPQAWKDVQEAIRFHIECEVREDSNIIIDNMNNGGRRWSIA